MKYRREIDGLRSIAVLPVMLFHAGVDWMPGGFIGVDIFFVISGYLITTMIYSDMVDGKFSVWSFYERRMRRILPALFVVIAATAILAWFWMVPSRLADFGNSVLAVCAFISNLYFWKATDYFAPDAELQPLLHTWSLAVEEQFYIVFPALMLLLFKYSRRRIVPILLMLVLASFGLAQWGRFGLPETRFFMPHTRAWELLLGALLAVAMKRGLPTIFDRLYGVLSIIGLAFIVVAVLFVNRDMQYPGAATLLPTIGAALIIACARPDTIVGRTLSSPFLVGIGLISYSAYLWHQPLLALARLREQGEPAFIILLGLCILSLALAYLTWHYIEQPMRNRSAVRRSVFFATTLASAALLAGTAWAFVSNKGFEQQFLARLDDKARADYALVLEAIASEQWSALYDDGACKFSRSDIDKTFEERFKTCFEKHGPATLIIGDSHAMDLYNAMAQATSSPFMAGVLKESCNPGPKRDARCPYRSITQFAKGNTARLRQIILTLSGDHFSADETGNSLRVENVTQVVEFLKTLPATLPVYWLGPQIETGFDLRDINPMFPKTHAPESMALAKMVNIDHLLAAAAVGVTYISKIDLVKFNASSEFEIEGRHTYSDRHHWSVFGEKLFGPRILAGLRQRGLTGL